MDDRPVYLTEKEEKLYHDYLEKLVASRTHAEAKIYQRRLFGLIAKGKSRGERRDG
ncbi:hypothetical protein LCM10_04715 [Rossellomorea aquimaris]|uniref:hypothetical protein n=1 Tax=Rossellomorea aquimaris TaxID=189382 RepID=UPI001CD35E31|nr:hypothetical protein [Rossellomorea aquimaris]MCA1054281.1 hypothetical protein [Rossellomorea aquimaris]